MTDLNAAITWDVRIILYSSSLGGGALAAFFITLGLMLSFLSLGLG